MPHANPHQPAPPASPDPALAHRVIHLPGESEGQYRFRLEMARELVLQEAESQRLLAEAWATVQPILDRAKPPTKQAKPRERLTPFERQKRKTEATCRKILAKHDIDLPEL